MSNETEKFQEPESPETSPILAAWDGVPEDDAAEPEDADVAHDMPVED